MLIKFGCVVLVVKHLVTLSAMVTVPSVWPGVPVRTRGISVYFLKTANVKQQQYFHFDHNTETCIPFTVGISFIIGVFMIYIRTSEVVL